MTFTFRIDTEALQGKDGILYFEDANASNSMYHGSKRNLDEAKEEVRRSMARLGGAVIQFIPVIFELPYGRGYLIEFVFRGGAFGQYPVSGLPVKTTNPSPVRDEKSRVQALLVAAHYFDAAYNSKQHMPMSNPLLLHLLADGEKTIAQMIAERQELPEQFLLTSNK